MVSDPKDVQLNTGSCLSGGRLRLASARAPPLPVCIGWSKVGSCLLYPGQWTHLPSAGPLLVGSNRHQTVLSPPTLGRQGGGTTWTWESIFDKHLSGSGATTGWGSDIWEPSAGGSFIEKSGERSMKGRPRRGKRISVAIWFLPP